MVIVVGGGEKEVDPLLRRWGKNIATTRARRRPDGSIRRPGQDAMSQTDLARLLNPTVSPTTVSRWESGKLEPTRARKLELAAALGVDPEQLFPLIESAA